MDLLRRKIINFKICYSTRFLGCLTTVAVFLFLPFHLNGQISSANEYQLKAAFIFNFTRFVNWPPAAANRPGTPFIISVLNEERLANQIRDLVKGEEIANRPIVVRDLQRMSEIGKSNILYVSGKDASEIKDHLSHLSQQGILTVSDAPNFARWGGIIRFFKDENKLRMQINIDEARKSRFDISSKLLNLSNIYRSK